MSENKYFRYFFVAVTFFLLGIGAAGLYGRIQTQKASLSSIKEGEKGNQPATTETEATTASKSAMVFPKQENLSYGYQSSGTMTSGTNDKFTLTESQRIYADKTSAQTGETVNFFVKLKNTGTKKKFLTHICFNYSGGNFGCQLNVNINAGEEISINNSMIFTSPGTFSVWLTWSQDGTNFYVPSAAGTANVRVY